MVPAGAHIPAGQMWAGNPAVYQRDLTEDEVDDMKKRAEEVAANARDHSHEFLPFGSAYQEAEKAGHMSA